MREYEWVVCKGCGEQEWLDLNEPMYITGWNTKCILFGDDELNFYLCDDCYCHNCPYSITFISQDVGVKYADYYCEYPNWENGLCVHLEEGRQM